MHPVSAAFLALTLLAAKAGAHSAAATLAEPSIGRILVGQSESEVVDRMGPPVSRRIEEGYYDLSVEFDRVSVYFTDGTVDAVLSSNPAFCLNTGVCPGHQYADAVKVLGDPFTTTASGTGMSSARFLTGIDCWIVVEEKEGTVQSVQVKCPT